MEGTSKSPRIEFQLILVSQAGKEFDSRSAEKLKEKTLCDVLIAIESTLIVRISPVKYDRTGETDWPSAVTRYGLLSTSSQLM